MALVRGLQTPLRQRLEVVLVDDAAGVMSGKYEGKPMRDPLRGVSICESLGSTNFQGTGDVP